MMEFNEIILPWSSKPVYFKPLCDIQYTGKDRDISANTLKKDINEGLENDSWFLGPGDFTDFTSPSNRKSLLAGGHYDNFHQALDDMADDLVKKLYERYLYKTKNRWAGIVCGHHYHVFQDGSTSDTRLCKLLNAPYLGTQGGIAIRFYKAGKYYTVRIMMHHGRSTANPLKKLEQWTQDWDCDIGLMGHCTKLEAKALPKLKTAYYKGQGSIISKSRRLIACGGYSKGYKPYNKLGDLPIGDYVEQGMMRPVDLGSASFYIIPHMSDYVINGKRFNYFDPIIKVTI